MTRKPSKNSTSDAITVPVVRDACSCCATIGAAYGLREPREDSGGDRGDQPRDLLGGAADRTEDREQRHEPEDEEVDVHRILNWSPDDL